MPVKIGQIVSSKDPVILINTDNIPIIRAWYLTDIDGVEHRIESERELQMIIDQMSPEEFEEWKTRIRFDPIFNGTSILSYTGQMRDIN